DRVHWTAQGPLDIRMTNGAPMSKGPYGTPTVWKEKGIWYLFYERGDLGVWLATSTNLKQWTNVQDDPVLKMGPEPYDRYAVAMNQVIQYQGRYYAYYHASAYEDWREWSTCVAVSDDLIHWVKYKGNPVIGNNTSSGIVVNDGKRFIMYTMHPDIRIFFPATTGR
ncbi:MAG TPA: glycosylase, partial [Agriterribacter sp.]|nr:glycosylase [Agriterribacter sp.]